MSTAIDHACELCRDRHVIEMGGDVCGHPRLVVCPACTSATHDTRRDAYRRIQLGLCDVLDVADALDPDTRQRLLAAARTISEAAHELRAPKE